jgi:hypothetical protein
VAGAQSSWALDSSGIQINWILDVWEPILNWAWTDVGGPNWIGLGPAGGVHNNFELKLGFGPFGLRAMGVDNWA